MTGIFESIELKLNMPARAANSLGHDLHIGSFRDAAAHLVVAQAPHGASPEPLEFAVRNAGRHRYDRPRIVTEQGLRHRGFDGVAARARHDVGNVEARRRAREHCSRCFVIPSLLPGDDRKKQIIRLASVDVKGRATAEDGTRPVAQVVVQERSATR
jgi:hypothetical protein